MFATSSLSMADSSHHREVERSRNIPAYYQGCGRPLLRKMLGYPGAGGDVQQQQHVVLFENNIKT
ncbi:hypothetical protein INR49_010549 [Caranx melampygus]|nr:hypothetical protein INR49_010549 [Caranx melampygus]